VRNTTWTLAREGRHGVRFAGVNYHDGQAFMVRAGRGARSVHDLDGARICVTRRTTTEDNLRDYFQLHGLRYEPVPFVRLTEMYAAYEAGFCDVVTADQSSLSANRARLSQPVRHVILPEVISKEPLGPAVRRGDDQWLDIVRWTLFAMLAAEEKGVTSRNARRVRETSPHREVRRLLGAQGHLGEALGLSSDWAYQIIVQVGNYGESFERNLGVGSAINLDRGLNALWRDGGLLYAMPFR
jgi:general L-amino acid transport system substrate-binding protein